MNETPETLGDMAEIFQSWKDDGVARGSVLYVVDRIWYEEDN